MDCFKREQFWENLFLIILAAVCSIDSECGRLLPSLSSSTLTDQALRPVPTENYSEIIGILYDSLDEWSASRKAFAYTGRQFLVRMLKKSRTATENFDAK
jgi:hypothetical protein